MPSTQLSREFPGTGGLWGVSPQSLCGLLCQAVCQTPGVDAPLTKSASEGHSRPIPTVLLESRKAVVCSWGGGMFYKCFISVFKLSLSLAWSEKVGLREKTETHCQGVLNLNLSLSWLCRTGG